ncbi:hypothetical protein Tco_0976655 [Tanacetum coccineum]|uniref:Uncharacterized protein n=1 Tax=Tanacetum coccineum TaxID=301880 RepID=A0ABQ5EI71_9ASTR
MDKHLVKDMENGSKHKLEFETITLTTNMWHVAPTTIKLNGTYVEEYEKGNSAFKTFAPQKRTSKEEKLYNYIACNEFGGKLKSSSMHTHNGIQYKLKTMKIPSWSTSSSNKTKENTRRISALEVLCEDFISVVCVHIQELALECKCILQMQAANANANASCKCKCKLQMQMQASSCKCECKLQMQLQVANANALASCKCKCKLQMKMQAANANACCKLQASNAKRLPF